MLHIEVVYPPEGAFTHPSTNRVPRALTNYVHATNAANLFATPPVTLLIMFASKAT